MSQDYNYIEYIIIDGGSTDGTVEVIKEALEKFPEKHIKFISERDAGIYDAMNKGIRLASGNIVGILNSDKFYPAVDIIDQVINKFETKGVDSIFADSVYVKRRDPDENGIPTNMVKVLSKYFIKNYLLINRP